jgi:hypothetical protein
MRDINHLRIVILLLILLLIRVKEGSLLRIVGSWMACRVVVVQYWLAWQLVSTSGRKHA